MAISNVFAKEEEMTDMESRNFRVSNNRVHFKCPECAAKRFLAIQPGMRKKIIRCHKCSTQTQCTFNRRTSPREFQSGNCFMITNSGKEIEVSLHDISMEGLGFNLPLTVTPSLTLRQELQFKCGWSPKLLQSRYIVKNIQGRRIGAQKVF